MMELAAAVVFVVVVLVVAVTCQWFHARYLF